MNHVSLAGWRQRDTYLPIEIHKTKLSSFSLSPFHSPSIGTRRLWLVVVGQTTNQSSKSFHGNRETSSLFNIKPTSSSSLSTWSSPSSSLLLLFHLSLSSPPPSTQLPYLFPCSFDMLLIHRGFPLLSPLSASLLRTFSTPTCPNIEMCFFSYSVGHQPTNQPPVPSQFLGVYVAMLCSC